MKIFYMAALFFTVSICLGSVPALSDQPPSSVRSTNPPPINFNFNLEENNLELWTRGILTSAAQAPGPASDGQPLVLAASQTDRPDILQHFRWYRGGWNLTNRHYWASVGFTGAAAFILAVVWFLSFGAGLAVHHFFGRKLTVKEEGSHLLQRICLILIFVFTFVAVTGCITLCIGQQELHDEATHTLNFAVGQSSYTVQTLRNVTEYLLLAKTIGVDQFYLPSEIKDKIDKLNGPLKTAADRLQEETSENSRKIKRVFDIVRGLLLSIAALMFLLSVAGLVLSYRGHRHAIRIFIVSGWVLVAFTFLLCGGFVVLNSFISDTCLAMEEWADNPQAETSLSNILPCVDQETTEQSLIQSKQVMNSIVNIVDQFIYTVADPDRSPEVGFPYYYNQSGPQVPPLCYPYDDRLQDRECSPPEVSLANASEVWKNFTCTVSGSGLCTGPGRLTPRIYSQVVTAVNISMALQLYTPKLLSLRNCNFVRYTFRNITTKYCPPLQHHLRLVNSGLALISAGVLLCLALWFLYANHPLREDVFANILQKLNKGYKTGCKKICNAGDTFRSTSTPGSIV